MTVQLGQKDNKFLFFYFLNVSIIAVHRVEIFALSCACYCDSQVLPTFKSCFSDSEIL